MCTVDPFVPSLLIGPPFEHENCKYHLLHHATFIFVVLAMLLSPVCFFFLFGHIALKIWTIILTIGQHCHFLIFGFGVAQENREEDPSMSWSSGCQ